MSDHFDQLRTIASEYCNKIEALEEQPDNRWLQDILHLLPQLNAAIMVFLRESEVEGQHREANLEVRFSLFSRLHELLGEKDAYWMEYDMGIDECKSGSLADDLTDIYCELKQGLRMLEEEREDKDSVLSNWRRGYRMHWGRHLLDAERHLYDLSAKGAI